MLIPFKDRIPHIGKNVFIAQGARVIGEVEIGDESSVWFNCVLRGDINLIKIGKRSNIQDLSTLHTWARTYSPNGELIDSGLPVIVGDDVTIGHNCVIHACTIKDRVLIGMNAVVMDGAVISEDSIVGAGSVVTKGKVFPPCSLILGNPAKVVRSLDKEEIAFLKQSALNYIAYKNDFLLDLAP